MQRMLFMTSLLATACGGPPKPSAPPPAPAPADRGTAAYTAYVHGTLAKNDLGSARADHDQRLP